MSRGKGLGAEAYLSLMPNPYSSEIARRAGKRSASRLVTGSQAELGNQRWCAVRTYNILGHRLESLCHQRKLTTEH